MAARVQIYWRWLQCVKIVAKEPRSRSPYRESELSSVGLLELIQILGHGRLLADSAIIIELAQDLYVFASLPLYQKLSETLCLKPCKRDCTVSLVGVSIVYVFFSAELQVIGYTRESKGVSFPQNENRSSQRGVLFCRGLVTESARAHKY